MEASPSLPHSLISNKQFDDLLKDITQINNDTFKSQKRAESGGLYLHIISRNQGETNFSRTAIGILCNFDDRYETFFKAGILAWESKIEVYTIFVAMEAWMKTFDIDQVQSSRPLSEYKDKKEVLLVIGSTIDGRWNTSSVDIKRYTRKGREKADLLETRYTFHEEAKKAKVSSGLVNSFYAGYADYRKEIYKKHGIK